MLAFDTSRSGGERDQEMCRLIETDSDTLNMVLKTLYTNEVADKAEVFGELEIRIRR
jgi:hypothetical protein